MTSGLGVVLESMMNSPGVVAGGLVDAHGVVIDYPGWVKGDLAASGAAANQLVRQWAFVGTELGMGPVRSLLIERPGGPVTITPLGQDAALLVVGGHSCRPGGLRLQAKRARDAMGHADRIGPDPVVSELDDADALEEALPVPPPRATAAEVVLIGTHTFRLVTKLIAHLLQLKGVRSSRLRAYSPNSTIVDVVLETGATLGAIDRTRLEEFSVERAEMGGARLVLRASRRPAIPPIPIGTP